MSNKSCKKPGDRSPFSARELTQSLKSQAMSLGFELTGVCPAVTPTGYASLCQWLDDGYAGEMKYLEDRKEAYQHPKYVFHGVKSLVMLGMPYKTQQPAELRAGFGRVSRYAWGPADYHDLIHDRLKALKRFVEQLPGKIGCRGVVDTAPLLEREFGQLAGIGWPAKNTMLINRNQGSWFFLAALLIDQEMEYDQPFEADHCGTCTACIDACPTNAFPEPGVLDATRCISYLTIEHRSPVPDELRASMGTWVFGCDICQEVCPWNRKTEPTREPIFRPESQLNPLKLGELFLLDDESFRKRFRKTPLWRPKRRGLLRNAAIALGNLPSDENLVALTLGLNDLEPLVRGASSWALAQHDRQRATPLLQSRQKIEDDPTVQSEIQRALGRLQ